LHELSIADAIVTIATEHAQGRRVTSVEVKIGGLRQVVADALTFAFELLTEGTELAGAELVVEHVPARVVCRDCAVESELTNFPFRCASCGTVDVRVVGGDELSVESLELAEEPIAGGAARGADLEDARAVPVRPSETSGRQAEKHQTLVGGR
jgi:hydrogenase nickel incorporation protein HypA/HybF